MLRSGLARSSAKPSTGTSYGTALTLRGFLFLFVHFVFLASASASSCSSFLISKEREKERDRESQVKECWFPFCKKLKNLRETVGEISRKCPALVHIIVMVLVYGIF